jgi:hypothetical protein
MFRNLDWNFSSTAETVVGALLAITLVSMLFV